MQWKYVVLQYLVLGPGLALRVQSLVLALALSLKSLLTSLVCCGWSPLCLYDAALSVREGNDVSLSTFAHTITLLLSYFGWVVVALRSICVLFILDYIDPCLLY